MPHGLPHCGSTLGPTLRHHQNYKCIYISGQVSAIVVGNKTQQRKFTQIKKLNNFTTFRNFSKFGYLDQVSSISLHLPPHWSSPRMGFLSWLGAFRWHRPYRYHPRKLLRTNVVTQCADPMCWPNVLTQCADPMCWPNVLTQCAHPMCLDSMCVDPMCFDPMFFEFWPNVFWPNVFFSFDPMCCVMTRCVWTHCVGTQCGAPKCLAYKNKLAKSTYFLCCTY